MFLPFVEMLNFMRTKSLSLKREEYAHGGLKTVSLFKQCNLLIIIQ